MRVSPVDIFLLTKPPGDPRTHLCKRMISVSDNPRLYLAGDGVYNLFGEESSPPQIQKILPAIYACREDLLARGVPLEGAFIPDDFYSALVKDVMAAERTYTF